MLKIINKERMIEMKKEKNITMWPHPNAVSCVSLKPDIFESVCSPLASLYRLDI